MLHLHCNECKLLLVQSKWIKSASTLLNICKLWQSDSVTSTTLAISDSRTQRTPTSLHQSGGCTPLRYTHTRMHARAKQNPYNRSKPEQKFLIVLTEKKKQKEIKQVKNKVSKFTESLTCLPCQTLLSDVPCNLILWLKWTMDTWNPK